MNYVPSPSKRSHGSISCDDDDVPAKIPGSSYSSCEADNLGRSSSHVEDMLHLLPQIHDVIDVDVDNILAYPSSEEDEDDGLSFDLLDTTDELLLLESMEHVDTEEEVAFCNGSSEETEETYPVVVSKHGSPHACEGGDDVSITNEAEPIPLMDILALRSTAVTPSPVPKQFATIVPPSPPSERHIQDPTRTPVSLLTEWPMPKLDRHKKYYDINELGPYDVITGRGKVAWNNRGNIYFRMIINQNVELYMSAPRVKQKSQVITSVIEYMQTVLEAKFVKLEQKLITNKDRQHPRQPPKYITLNQRETHDKVGHAFRDAVKRRALANEE